MQYNPVAGWQNQTLQYVGNSALYLNEEQAGAPAVVVTLECIYYPANKIYLNKEWHPDKGMWGRLTTAHRGFMVGDRLLHYPKTQLLRHFDLVTKMRLALQAEHVAILNYLDEGALDLTEPTSWMDFILDTVFGPAGNNLYGTSDQAVGAHPTEFRLATHPEAEWEWNVWWMEWDDVVMNLDPPLPPAGEPGPDEPSPPDEPPEVPDEIPNDPVPPEYFEDDFGPQAEPTPEYPDGTQTLVTWFFNTYGDPDYPSGEQAFMIDAFPIEFVGVRRASWAGVSEGYAYLQYTVDGGDIQEHQMMQHGRPYAVENVQLSPFVPE